jgi:hypothetical protein
MARVQVLVNLGSARLSSLTDSYLPSAAEWFIHTHTHTHTHTHSAARESSSTRHYLDRAGASCAEISGLLRDRVPCRRPQGRPARRRPPPGRRSNSGRPAGPEYRTSGPRAASRVPKRGKIWSGHRAHAEDVRPWNDCAWAGPSPYPPPRARGSRRRAPGIASRRTDE